MKIQNEITKKEKEALDIYLLHAEEKNEKKFFSSIISIIA
jgi:hypothetical protein